MLSLARVARAEKKGRLRDQDNKHNPALPTLGYLQCLVAQRAKDTARAQVFVLPTPGLGGQTRCGRNTPGCKGVVNLSIWQIKINRP